MIDVLWHDNCYKATIMTGWWFQTLFIFHHIWDVILPIDELHHFSKGLKPPTSSGTGFVVWGTLISQRFFWMSLAQAQTLAVAI